MKIRSLLLGSVAAAGLATGAQAADLGVLTSLDVCDSLGLSGLTISSDTNCLQITGEVAYRFRWGDFHNQVGGGNNPIVTGLNLSGNNVAGGAIGGGAAFNAIDGNGFIDWESQVTARLGLVATADSEFGPATAHITFFHNNDNTFRNTANPPGLPLLGANDTTYWGGVAISEAWVSVA